MRGRGWLIVAFMALIGVLFLAGYPARSYLAQKEQRREMALRVQALQADNKTLEQQVQHLQTDAEIERLARRDYNLVRPGEEVYAVAPPPASTIPPAPPAPKREPDRGWPQRALDWVAGIF